MVRTKQAERALESAKEEFSAQNKLLLIELPQFYEKRVDYFQPCLQALVRSQVNYYGETNSLFTHMAHSSAAAEEGGAGGGVLLADKEYQNDIDKHMSAIKSLSIVGK